MEGERDFISDRRLSDRRLFDRRVLGSQTHDRFMNAGNRHSSDRRLHDRRSGADKRSQHVIFEQLLADACAACGQMKCQCREA
jgi:hypothetical protein